MGVTEGRISTLKDAKHPSELFRVQTRTNVYHSQSVYVKDGRLQFYAAGEVSFSFLDSLVNVSLASPAEAAHEFQVGQSVIVRKYGNLYPAIVEKIGRTLVTVSFTTNAGKVRRVSVPATDLRGLRS